jgi:DNA-binding PadR family transcriptional regulator
MGKESLGEFEHQVLLAILRLGSESYSVPIVMELEQVTERPVAPAAVYIALRRLEKRGLVSSRMDMATPEEGGRPRRYFRLQPEAVERIKESRRVYERLWDGIGPALERR